MGQGIWDAGAHPIHLPCKRQDMVGCKDLASGPAGLCYSPGEPVSFRLIKREQTGSFQMLRTTTLAIQSTRGD